MVLLAVACSSRSDILETSDATTTASSTTEPRLDEGDVRDDVEIQVSEAQLLIDRLYRAPEVAEDHDHPEVVDFVGHHVDGSGRVEGFLTELDDLAADGHRHELHRDTDLTRSHVVVYDINLTGADAVELSYCVAMDVTVVDEDDETVEDLAQLEVGDGTARLVEDDWLIDAWEETNTVQLVPGNVIAHECSLYDFGDEDGGVGAADAEDEGTSADDG